MSKVILSVTCSCVAFLGRHTTLSAPWRKVRRCLLVAERADALVTSSRATTHSLAHLESGTSVDPLRPDEIAALRQGLGRSQPADLGRSVPRPRQSPSSGYDSWATQVLEALPLRQQGQGLRRPQPARCMSKGWPSTSSSRSTPPILPMTLPTTPLSLSWRAWRRETLPGVSKCNGLCLPVIQPFTVLFRPPPRYRSRSVSDARI